jgi:hypothetical protein
MTNTETKTPRRSTTEEALNKVKVEIARLEVKLDTALSFRADLRREFEEHKRYVERDLVRLMQEMAGLDAKLEATLEKIELRLRGLELSDNTHDNYFRSIGFARDLFFGLVLAAIGTGVFFN